MTVGGGGRGGDGGRAAADGGGGNEDEGEGAGQDETRRGEGRGAIVGAAEQNMRGCFDIGNDGDGKMQASGRSSSAEDDRTRQQGRGEHTR